jgi:CheY-like chemotaxis protein
MSAATEPTPRVLLVEDNETIRRAFALLLEESGYSVRQASTGQEALAEARANPPDLVLMDLGLPDLNGLDVTRKLKADPLTASSLVIAITGRALETDQAACLEAGCVGYLAKPIDTNLLLRKLPEYLASRGA